MSKPDAIAPLAAERGVLPHRDPTFDAVVRAIAEGDQPIDWKLTGPLMVRQQTADPRYRGRGHRRWLDKASVSDRPLQLNLEPDVAAELLRHLDRIAERRPSRSGKTTTYGMKKGPAATGPESNQNR
jgi:hypothetical protein